jgi:hypothetical protein
MTPSLLCIVLLAHADPPSSTGTSPATQMAVQTDRRQAAPAFDRGWRIGIGAPTVGGMTVLSERRSALTLGFAFEAGYVFAPRNRPHLRIGLGGSWLWETHLLYGERSGRFEWLTKLRIGGAWGRTFAYTHLGVGPAIWHVRDEEGRRTVVQPSSALGLGVVWAVGRRSSLGLEADVGASARSRSDAVVRWSGRVMFTHRFGCSGDHAKRR